MRSHTLLSTAEAKLYRQDPHYKLILFAAYPRDRIVMHIRLKRTPGLYLTGFMGCGKTTVGRLLADELGWNFADIDAEIEREQRETIARIFSERGEPVFRALESDAIRRRIALIEAGCPTVVALGGGALTVQLNWELIERNGITIWLDCPFDRIRSRIGGDASRPLARDALQFERLFELRRPLYARAHFSVDAAADNPQEIARTILDLPIF